MLYEQQFKVLKMRESRDPKQFASLPEGNFARYQGQYKAICFRDILTVAPEYLTRYWKLYVIKPSNFEREYVTQVAFSTKSSWKA